MKVKNQVFETITPEGKTITLSDLIKEFRKYSQNHPLYIASLNAFDQNGNINKKELYKYSNIINSYIAIHSALQTLYRRDVEVYQDFVLDKLKAEDKKNGYDKQRLISAIAEIVVIYNFTNSHGWTEFNYENKISETSKKDVDFTITYPDHKFHVEIKTFDLQSRHEKISSFIAQGKSFVEINHNLPDTMFICLKDRFKDRIVHSIDNRVTNFVTNAIKKFPNTKNTKESNVLLFNYNDKIEQIDACLIKNNVGCLTKLNNSNILDFVVSTSLYSRIEYFLEVLINPSLLMLAEHSPFYMHFCKWSIVVPNNSKFNSAEHKILSSVCFNAETCTQNMADNIPDFYMHFKR